MTENHNAAGHHTAAAAHYERAAQHHREAARHYQTGKDYQHAAHQALLARGHAMQAMQHENDATSFYLEHDGKAAPSAEIA